MTLEQAIAIAENKPAAYVIGSEDTSYLYKGATRDLKKRLTAHLLGKISRTKNRRPLIMVYYKYFEDFSDARKHEIFLKQGQGREWLKQHIDGIR